MNFFKKLFRDDKRPSKAQHISSSGLVCQFCGKALNIYEMKGGKWGVLTPQAMRGYAMKCIDCNAITCTDCLKPIGGGMMGCANCRSISLTPQI